MKRYIYILVALFAFSSCGKFLEPKSQSEFTPKTVQALSEMLLGDGYPASQANPTLFSYHNIFDDDIKVTNEAIGYEGTNMLTGEMLRYVFSWHPDMYTKLVESNSFRDVWAGYYKKILTTNAALDYVDGVSGTSQEKNKLKAEAYALRAFFYFHLINLYGEPYNYNKKALGVPLKLKSSYEGIYASRNTVEEVYNQIVSDLNAAEENYLKIAEDKRFVKNYHTSLPMVQLMKARVALYMENMDVAATYAQKVINEWGFKLYDLNRFTATTSAPYPNYVTYDNPETIWAYGAPADLFGFVYTSGRYSNEPNVATRRTFNVSDALLAEYADTDLRKTTYFTKERVEYYNPSSEVIEDELLCFGKAKINAKYEIEDGTAFGMSLRLSEAYLIVAEACQVSDPARALRAINDLRKARIKSANYTEVTAAGDALVELIRSERRREMCFEGHRWFDLRRQGMPSFTRTWREDYGKITKNYTIEKNDPAYTLPIPQNVLDANPNLVQNKLTQPK